MKQNASDQKKSSYQDEDTSQNKEKESFSIPASKAGFGVRFRFEGSFFAAPSFFALVLEFSLWLVDQLSMDLVHFALLFPPAWLPSLAA